MALIKNQYGTFETTKQTGTPRLPVTEQQEIIAQRAYGKNFSELTTEQRTKIRAGKLIEDKITFEQYLEDYKGMANDPTYQPKYIKSGVGVGISPQQKRALAEARKTIEGFDAKYQRNINKRKKLKRAADPEKRESDIIKKAERQQKRRVKEKDIKPSTREEKINFEQRKIARAFNKPIKENPNIVLKDAKLMDQLSTTVSKDGDIIKIKPNLSQLKERGLYEIDHQRDIYKEGKMKNLPYNRNLILGPHNRSGGFKAMAEKFIEKNPDSPKVKTIIEKADELKVTLQPNVPKGTFPTKSLGYKQLADPLTKFTEVIKQTIPKLPKKVAVPAIATASLIGATGTASADDELPIEFNKEIGAFVDPKTDDKVSQATLLDWAANNPMPTAAIASTPLLSKTVRKGTGKLLSGLLSALGTSAAGLTFAGLTVKGNLDEGKNIVDATVDPLVGLELLYPEAVKRFGGKGLQNALGRALSFGRYGAMMTPVGAGITALGLGKMGVEALIDERERILNMTPEELEIFRAEQEEQMGMSA